MGWELLNIHGSCIILLHHQISLLIAMDVGFKPNHLIPWFSCVPSIVFFSVVSIEIAHCLNIVKISENSVRSLQFHMLRMVVCSLCLSSHLLSMFCSFGSFFGPSQPVIAQRVIQESKSLLENQHLAAKVSRPHHDVSSPSLWSGCGSTLCI